MVRKRAGALGALALALLAAGCSSSGSTGSTGANGSSAASSSPFRIVAIVATTGAFQSTTAFEVAGLRAGINVVNSEGGILGHKVTLTVQNDNGDPTTAASVLQQDLSGGQSPSLLFPGITSNETLAMMPISTAHKILSMGLTSSTETVNPQTHPYEFSVASNNNDSAATLVASTKKSQPAAKSVGIIIANDTNGSTLLQQEKSAFESAGYQVYVQQYSDSALDLTPQMQALAADHPDVIIASAFGPAAGYILQARAKLALSVPVIGDTDFAANPLPAMVPAADLKGVYISTQSQNLYRPPAQQSQALRTFFTNVAKEGYSKITLPYVLASLAYDIPILAKVAATQANSIDAVAITHALENLKQPAQPQWVSWPNYKFSSTKHSPIYEVSSLASFGTAYLHDGMNVSVGQQP